MPYLRPKTFLNLPPRLYPVVYNVPGPLSTEAPPLTPHTMTRRAFAPPDHGRATPPERSIGDPTCYKRVTEIRRNQIDGQDIYDVRTSIPPPASVPHYPRSGYWLYDDDDASIYSKEPISTAPGTPVIRSYRGLAGNSYQMTYPNIRTSRPISRRAMKYSSPSYQSTNQAITMALRGMSPRPPSSSAYFNNNHFTDFSQSRRHYEEPGRYTPHGYTPTEEYSTNQPLRLPRVAPRSYVDTLSPVPTPQVLNPLIQEVVYEDDYPSPTGVYSPAGSQWPPPRMELFYMPPEDYPMPFTRTANIKNIVASKQDLKTKYVYTR